MTIARHSSPSAGKAGMDIELVGKPAVEHGPPFSRDRELKKAKIRKHQLQKKGTFHVGPGFFTATEACAAPGLASDPQKRQGQNQERRKVLVTQLGGSDARYSAISMTPSNFTGNLGNLSRLYAKYLVRTQLPLRPAENGRIRHR